ADEVNLDLVPGRLTDGRVILKPPDPHRAQQGPKPASELLGGLMACAWPVLVGMRCGLGLSRLWRGVLVNAELAGAAPDRQHGLVGERLPRLRSLLMYDRLHGLARVGDVALELSLRLRVDVWRADDLVDRA